MVIKSGYVDVKLPPSARNSSTWKSWKRKWVDLTQLDSAPGQACEVLLEVRASRNSGVQARGTLSPKTAQVFRCNSGSREFAVAVRSGQRQPMVFLAGDSETQSQEWMAALRALLWPPVPMVELENVLGFNFEASLIDDAWSGRAGLLGSYGNLSISGHKLILTHPHTEHVIQEWYLNTLTRFQVYKNKHEADHGKLLAIECGSESSTGKGVLQFYCPEALNFVYTLRGVVQGILKRMTHEQYSWREQQEMRTQQSVRRESLLPQHAPDTQDSSGYSVPKSNAISVLQMPTFKGPLPPPRLDEGRGFPCSRQSHLSISTFDSGISVTSGPLENELESPVSEVAFSVSSDTSEGIYERLEDVLLRRPSLETKIDVPPPLPPKNHKRRKSEPTKSASAEEAVSVSPSPNKSIVRPCSMPGALVPCVDEFGEHVLHQSMEAPQATDCPSLEEKEKMDTNLGETEPTVASADNNGVTSEICAEARNVTGHTLQHTDVAQLADQAEETRVNWAEQSVLQDKIRPCSMVASCCHARCETARTRAFSLPSMYIR
ncbi:hypothetical protein HPB48_006852 [Haemaphysalis longicornis]|uniref:PH domain-containing protein n=1 Tax=Haemaphysalis longicornis TaxID=44386 RepID=A0A9J6FE57_HAELO|nr:hypothetical protein HPB48_006852 [Haemaphysalis longicornis]